MRICLTADSKRSHAYIPAFLVCTSFLDVLACLYAGNLKPKGQKHVMNYARDFMDQDAYPELSVALLWQMFRHKVTHTMQPYGVYDSHSGSKADNPLLDEQRMWVTWRIYASDRKPPIELREDRGVLVKRPPWPTAYTHRCAISLHRLQVDIPNSVLRGNGYLSCLKRDSEAAERFLECMKMIFPPQIPPGGGAE